MVRPSPQSRVTVYFGRRLELSAEHWSSFNPPCDLSCWRGGEQNDDFANGPPGAMGEGPDCSSRSWRESTTTIKLEHQELSIIKLSIYKMVFFFKQKPEMKGSPKFSTVSHSVHQFKKRQLFAFLLQKCLLQMLTLLRSLTIRRSQAHMIPSNSTYNSAVEIPYSYHRIINFDDTPILKERKEQISKIAYDYTEPLSIFPFTTNKVQRRPEHHNRTSPTNGQSDILKRRVAHMCVWEQVQHGTTSCGVTSTILREPPRSALQLTTSSIADFRTCNGNLPGPPKFE